ncbi:MAG: enoyl-CoA hydratase/isomerase family protein [Pseudomonadota bacterium]
MLQPLFLEEIGDDGVARITLTRPAVHNAINEVLVSELTTVFKGLDSDSRVRAVVLAAQGKSFCAGADLNWMRTVAGFSEDRNVEDAENLAELMTSLNQLSKPTVAMVQGPVFGGGVGLVACCDVAIAAETARFCLSEVKVGLIPAVISPYVIASIGERAARRYFLTAEDFSAWEAHRLGLVQEVVPRDSMEPTCRRILDAILLGGPEAQADAKSLIFSVTGRPISDALRQETTARIAKRRTSEEGKEGIDAFLAKRKPSWVMD